MRRSLFVSFAVSLLIGCHPGVTATPSSPPRPRPPTPAPQAPVIPQPDPPAAKSPEFLSAIPRGWLPMPGADEDGVQTLVNPIHQGMILFVPITSGLSPQQVVEKHLATFKTFTYGKVEVSKDGLRAWAALKIADPKDPISGLLVVRRFPKGPNAPEEHTMLCIGKWPSVFDAQLSKDLSDFIDGFKYQ